ncbi:MAG: 5'/3'-nucleotidase SurE [Anaerolineae bacterium]|jgi:5'-nucleotidase|nr:5'/3'-nucleotidase SurE [Anaerolineae bacterium]MBT7072845.1 5'/3'-nucleotidase SurE [Anaerolineae bacterium]MBT7326324.1 5'/3'-nucleotidase SurE [Anaerolineae bacterium]
MEKHILVTNDDGVTAPGLLALAQEMRKLGKVSILAPDRNWSGSGHVKTLDRALRVREVILADGTQAFAGDGAPSDCVALATLGYLKEKIDLVVSGINIGANLGHDVTYSGTVTAAMEAIIAGIPAVAVSLEVPEDHVGMVDFAPAAKAARQVVEHVLAKELPEETFLNVNLPFLPSEQLRGFRLTRLGLRVYHSRLDERVDPRGRPYYWIGGEAPTGVPERGTDIGALADRYVSITPLHLDLTAYRALTDLNTWDWSEKAIKATSAKKEEK